MANLILPPKNIVGNIDLGSVSVNATYSNPASVWDGYPFSFDITLTITPQTNSSEDTTPTPYEWNGNDISVGMWLGQINGNTYQIVAIASQNATTVVCTIEDTDLYCLLVDNTSTGNNYPQEGQNSLIFDISEDGMPVVTPVAQITGLIGTSAQWLDDLHDRFRYRNYLTKFFSLDPNSTIYASFNVGDFVKLQSTGDFAVVTGNTQADIESIIGIVSSVNTPTQGNLRIRPLGKVVYDVNLTGIGAIGDVIYLDASGTLTATQPTPPYYAVYIKMSNTSAVLLPRVATGGGGGSGTSGNSGSSGTSGAGVANYYGSFSDSTTQVITGANTPTEVSYNTTEISQGISIANGTQIKVANAGVYNIGYSFQIEKTSGGGASDVDIWAKINGNDEPRTNSRIQLQSNSSLILPFVSYVFELNANDYVEFVFSSNNASVQLTALPLQTTPYVRPASPSAIIVAYEVGVAVSGGSSGVSGTSGTSGISGTDGTSGTSGESGTSGFSGTDGTSGTSG